MKRKQVAAFWMMLFLAPWFVAAQQPNLQPKPPADLAKGDSRDKLIVSTVARVIEEVHLSGKLVDESISERMHRLFVEQWDPRKLFFLEGDIAELAEAHQKHAKFIAAGDLKFPVRVYELYIQRLGERNAWAQEILKERFDFSKETTVYLDAKTARYPKTEAEAKERLRDWIKYELCSLIVDGVKEEEARARIQKRYRSLLQNSQRLDKDDLLERYLASLANSFDPHSGYLSAKSLEEFEIAMRLQLQGIGAALNSDDGKTIVKEIIAGGPAADDKRLKVGDQITGVGQGDDGEMVDVVDMSLSRVVQLIRGKAGTKVRLEVIPVSTGQRVVYLLTRRQVTLTDKGAKGEIIEAPGPDPQGPKLRVGVIDVPSFYGGSGAPGTGLTADLTKIFTRFKQQGVDAVVMDLRFNGGGLLQEGIGAASLLLDRGPIVQVKDFQGNVQQHEDTFPGVAYDGPLVVLVNRLSASASEIFAGAIQDYRRGLIVGDASTFGKGSVTQVIDLARLVQTNLPQRERKFGAVMVTLQGFYRVNGETTQKRGVVPDVILPSVTDRADLSESKLDYVLDFDPIRPAKFVPADTLSRDAVKKIQELSAERRAKSEEFAKLTHHIDRLRQFSARTKLTFTEAQLKQFRTERKELAAFALGGEPDAEPEAKKEKKFGETPYEREVLAIVGDVVRVSAKR